MKIDDGVGCRQAKVSEKMEAAFKGRQTKEIEKVNEGVEGCQVTRSEKMESKAVRQGRSRQSRLASRGDRNEDQKKPKVGHVLANEGYLFVL